MNEGWPQLMVTADASELDALEEAMFEAGAQAVTAEDAGDAPIFEPPPGTTPPWQRTRLRALFPRGETLVEVRRKLSSRWPALRFELDHSLAERDWEREWLRHFRPLRFGERLWVCPGGMRVDGEDAVVVTLDPGLAFGTGTHPSTASCLTWLDTHPPRGARVLDYGCGSGVLAIAALKLGAREVTCVDIDPQALIATRANAQRNAVGAALHIVEPACLAGPFDVLLANILAGPLVTLAPTLAALAAPGARLKLAGILDAQASDVAAAYAPWFEVAVAPIDGEWSAVTGVRKPAE